MISIKTFLMRNLYLKNFNARKKGRDRDGDHASKGGLETTGVEELGVSM